MSGAETTATLPAFDWFISFGNVLSIIISITVVIGAIITLVRYLRKNVTAEVINLKDDVKKDLGYIREKVEAQQISVDKGFLSARERMEELKEQIHQIERRLEQNRAELQHAIEQNKVDADKALDRRVEETAQLVEKLDTLREEYHRLALETSKKADRTP